MRIYKFNCPRHVGVSLVGRFVSCVLFLACFGVSPVWAYKAGEGADDIPVSVTQYVDVAAYLADPRRDENRYVKIGQYTVFYYQVEGFHRNNGLTDSNLIATYDNVAAYRADSGRADRLYASIGENIYLVSVLEAANNAGTLSDSNLPAPEPLRFATTALGDNARATDYEATAVGHAAQAAGDQSTAIGEFSAAFGSRSTALGDNARAYSLRSSALGRWSHAYGEYTTAVGEQAASYGRDATSVGRHTVALGGQTTALGRGALAANLSAGQYLGDVVPESDGLAQLIECAVDPRLMGDVESFVAGCDEYLTSEERADARLIAETAMGDAFRLTIRERLQGRLDALSTDRATAVGSYARALNFRTTAVGQYSFASGDHSTALGSFSRALGDRSTAAGVFSAATGSFSTALGFYSQAHGENTIAVGRASVAGGISASVYYTNVDEYLRDPDRLTRGNVIIGDMVYSVAALEAVSNLDSSNLPTPLTAASGSIAVGVNSEAAGTDNIALGRGASTTGTDAIAIGADAVAGTGEVTIGSASHTYKLPGLAAAQSANPEVLTVDGAGELSGDGGALHVRVGAAETGLGATTDAADATGSVYARIAQVQTVAAAADTRATAANTRATAADTRLGTTSDSANADGSAYARIAQLKNTLDTLGDSPANADVALLRESISTVDTRVGSADDAADATGSAYARIAQVKATAEGTQASLGTTGDAADATGSAYARIAQVKAAAEGTQASLGATGDTASATGSAYARIAQVKAAAEGTQASLGATGDTADATGSAYARIAQTQASLGATSDSADAAGSAYARIAQVKAVADGAQASLGTTSDAASATGSAYARVAQVKATADGTQASLGATSDSADAAGSAYARVASLKAIVDAAESEDLAAAAVGQRLDETTQALEANSDAVREIYDDLDLDTGDRTERVETARIRTGTPDERVVVTLKGATNAQIATLVALLTDRKTSNVPARDNEGNLVGTDGGEFLALDEVKGTPASSNERLGYLFQAIYGQPYSETGFFQSATDSNEPHADSIAGRLESMEVGELQGAYQTVPEIGSGTNAAPAPATAQDRRVVVQDTNQDGSIRLRTLDMDDLSGVDNRVSMLDKRIDRVAAMTSALSALPNVVPNEGRFYVGAGVGHYRSQQALAIGISTRVEIGEKLNIHLNVGGAGAGAGSASARAGVGFVW